MRRRLLPALLTLLTAGGSLAAGVLPAQAATTVTVTAFAFSARTVDATNYGATTTATVHLVSPGDGVTSLALFGSQVSPAPDIDTSLPLAAGIGKLTSGTATDGVWTIPVSVAAGYARTSAFQLLAGVASGAQVPDLSSQLAPKGFANTIITRVTAPPARPTKVSTSLKVGTTPAGNPYVFASTQWSITSGTPAATYGRIKGTNCGTPVLAKWGYLTAVGPAPTTGQAGFDNPPLVAVCTVTLTVGNDAGSVSVKASSLI